MLLAISSFLACEKENDANPDNSYFWSPIIKVEKGDKKATLYLIDPRPFSNYTPPGPTNPDYFNIMISEDAENFSLYKKVDVSTSNVPVENLTNNKSYYFMVISYKGKQDPVISGTVMTIPSEEIMPEYYLGNVNFSTKRLSTSYDRNYVSFISNDYIENTVSNFGRDMLYYKANTSDIINIVEENAFNANWSQTKNRLVYLTEHQDGNTIYPYKLKLFDPESKTSTTLFEIHYDDYYVINPAFTPDGVIVTFLSSKNNTDKYTYDLWKINPATGEQTKLSNFEDLGFFTDSKYEWAFTGEDIFLDGRNDKSSTANDIYKFNVPTKKLTTIIESQWNDTNPALSPDNTKIAFVSNRTGKHELWIYDMVNAMYSQVTGGSDYYFDARYSNIQWLTNNQILITLFQDSKSIAVKVNVNVN